jgi:Zn finger protein HypA/HybF involved in hydrogenase expression
MADYDWVTEYGPTGGMRDAQGRWWCGKCGDELETSEEIFAGTCEVCQITDEIIAEEQKKE